MEELTIMTIENLPQEVWTADTVQYLTAQLQQIGDYLYTLNVYFAGIFVVIIIMLLIKSLIGFMNIFL